MRWLFRKEDDFTGALRDEFAEHRQVGVQDRGAVFPEGRQEGASGSDGLLPAGRSCRSLGVRRSAVRQDGDLATVETESLADHAGLGRLEHRRLNQRVQQQVGRTGGIRSVASAQRMAVGERPGGTRQPRADSRGVEQVADQPGDAVRARPPLTATIGIRPSASGGKRELTISSPTGRGVHRAAGCKCI